MDTLKDVKLKSKKEDLVAAGDLFVEGNVVGLYFSAHWCPPCRAFTPQLAKWYKNCKAGANGTKLEIIFVSSDRDAAQFDEYYAEMPWLALPYENRDEKAALSTKFKVSGIPTLVLLDDQGKVLTKEGRSIVMEDPEGDDFPWKPKSFLDIIPGKLVNREGGDDLDWNSVTEDYVGLYFSAHWCGPCRAFTPQLVKTYSAVRDAGKSFQIIFVSSDRDEESMKEYLSEMPWLAIPYDSKDKRKKQLSRMFEVSGIPTLVILNKDGEVITQNGRAALSQDPEGKDFPWIPKPANPLNGSTASSINDEACIIWFTKEAEKEKASEILTSLSLQHKKEMKEEKAEPLLFFYHTEDDDDEEISQSLRSFCNIGRNSELVLLDIPNQSMYVLPDGEKVNAESVGKVVADYRSKTLAMKPIRS